LETVKEKLGIKKDDLVEKNEELVGKKEELEKLEKKKEELSNEISAKKKKKKNERQISTLDDSIQKLELSLQELDDSIQKQKAKIAKLNSEIKDLKANLKIENLDPVTVPDLREFIKLINIHLLENKEIEYVALLEEPEVPANGEYPPVSRDVIQHVLKRLKTAIRKKFMLWEGSRIRKENYVSAERIHEIWGIVTKTYVKASKLTIDEQFDLDKGKDWKITKEMARELAEGINSIMSKDYQLDLESDEYGLKKTLIDKTPKRSPKIRKANLRRIIVRLDVHLHAYISQKIIVLKDSKEVLTKETLTEIWDKFQAISDTLQWPANQLFESEYTLNHHIVKIFNFFISIENCRLSYTRERYIVRSI